MNQMVSPKPKTKKGDLKIDLTLHSKLKAKAALSEPRQGLNEMAEDHLWPLVGGKPVVTDAPKKARAK